MADDIRPEDEVSEKQIDDFYSYVAEPTQGNPFREHWSRTRHLPSCGHRVFGAGTSCSCCVGSMTFATEDNFVNDMLKQPDDEGKVCKNLTDMDLLLQNCKLAQSTIRLECPSGTASAAVLAPES